MFALHPLLNPLIFEDHLLNTSLLLPLPISHFCFRNAQLQVSSGSISSTEWFVCQSPGIDPKDLPLCDPPFPGGMAVLHSWTFCLWLVCLSGGCNLD